MFSGKRKWIIGLGVLAVSTVVSVLLTMPVRAEQPDIPAVLSIKAVSTASGTAEAVVTGRQLKLKKGSAFVVKGLYGDEYVIKYGGKICLFPISQTQLKDSTDMSPAATGKDGAASPAVWPTLEDVLRNAVLTEVVKHVGQDYVWGAAGPNQFDCSGLMRYAYWKSLGYLLPRVSYRQQNVDEQISMDEVKPGDLLFFKFGTRGELYGVNHTGMYVGNMQMIDAKGTAYGVIKETIKKRKGPTWPVKVVSPITAILRRYPPIIAAGPDDSAASTNVQTAEPAATDAPATAEPSQTGDPNGEIASAIQSPPPKAPVRNAN